MFNQFWFYNMIHLHVWMCTFIGSEEFFHWVIEIRTLNFLKKVKQWVVSIVFLLNSVMCIFSHASLSEIRYILLIMWRWMYFFFLRGNPYSSFRRSSIKEIQNQKTLRIEATSQKYVNQYITIFYLLIYIGQNLNEAPKTE